MIGLSETTGHADLNTSEVRAIGILDEVSPLHAVFPDGRVPLMQAMPSKVKGSSPDGGERVIIGLLVPVSAMTATQVHQAAELCAGIQGNKAFAECIADLRKQGVFPIHVSHFNVILALTPLKLGAVPAAGPKQPSASVEGGL